MAKAAPQAELEVRAKEVTDEQIQAFYDRMEVAKTIGQEMTADVGKLITQRIVAAQNWEEVLEAGEISLPSLEDYDGQTFTILEYALLNSSYEGSVAEAYAVVTIVTASGEKEQFSLGGITVLKQLFGMDLHGAIPTPKPIVLRSKKTGAGYDVYWFAPSR